MTTTPYPIRLSDDLLSLSRVRARDEHVDQATALRQLLYMGAEQYLLHLIQDGRISIGKAAEILNVTVYDLQHTAKRIGMKIGSTKEQARKSRKTAMKAL